MGAEGWELLKIGMSADQATEALGLPLIKSVGGSGFELWIYDNDAEVVFYGGPLVAWTTPRNGKSPGRSVDIWQRKAGVDAPAFILPRARPKIVRIDRRDENRGPTFLSTPFYRVYR